MMKADSFAIDSENALQEAAGSEIGVSKCRQQKLFQGSDYGL